MSGSDECVSVAEGQEYARINEMNYYETSIVDDTGLEESFMDLVH